MRPSVRAARFRSVDSAVDGGSGANNLLEKLAEEPVSSGPVSGPEFPVKQGKYREFYRIGRQSAGHDVESLAVLSRLRIKFPNHRNREFLQ
jgi:hypothetical protein